MLPEVPPDGPRDATIALVGEAPGPTETRERKPFVGGAGYVLNRALATAGLYRHEVYITNVSKRQPVTDAGTPTTDFRYLYHDRARRLPTPELSAARASLIEELRGIGAHVVVALGDEALRALTGKHGITKWRGSILWSEAIGKKVVAAIHPAAIIREIAHYPLLIFDLQRAKAQGAFAAYNPPKRTILTAPTFAQAQFHLLRLRTARQPVSFDIETDPNGQPQTMLCVAFSDSPTWAITIPVHFYGQPYWPTEESEVLQRLVRALLEDEQVPKIAQNAQYDVLWLQHYEGWRVRPICFDTMTAHHTVYPELPKDLGTLASLYTEQPYHKGMVDENPGSAPVLYEYNALDAAVTYECYQALRHELKDYGTEVFYYEYVLPLMHPLMEMQERGVLVDLAQRAAVDAQLTEELRDFDADFQVEARGVTLWNTPPLGVNRAKQPVALPHPGLNALSPTQLKTLLYETLRLPKRHARATGKETTEERALEDLYKTYKHPTLRLILEIRHRQKLLGTYIRAPLGDDRRLHCSYVVGGTVTGRLASRESIFGNGTNLQNVPKGPARRMLIPDAGLVFVEADLSQAEVRVVAYLAGETRLIDIFERGGDVHRATAALLLNKPIADVSEVERSTFKMVVHATNYGMGAYKLADELFLKLGIVVTRDEAMRLLHLRHATFPRIKVWQAAVSEQLRGTRTLKTPLGRKRTFMSWVDKDRENRMREAYAYVPQSTVGDLLNRGLLDVWARLARVDEQAALMLQVHDSLIVQCRPTHVAPVVRLLKECLERPIKIGERICKIPVDIKVGPNWQDLEKYSQQGGGA